VGKPECEDAVTILPQIGTLQSWFSSLRRDRTRAREEEKEEAGRSERDMISTLVGLGWGGGLGGVGGNGTVKS